jgi:transposase
VTWASPPSAGPRVSVPPEVLAARRAMSRPRPVEGWLTPGETSDLPELRSFANGVRRDQQAVTAGLTLPYSSAAVEGTVTKIKMVKRQMYGRASFALLRKRVILHPQ